jgi:hypothetical protein
MGKSTSEEDWTTDVDSEGNPIYELLTLEEIPRDLGDDNLIPVSDFHGVYSEKAGGFVMKPGAPIPDVSTESSTDNLYAFASSQPVASPEGGSIYDFANNSQPGTEGDRGIIAAAVAAGVLGIAGATTAGVALYVGYQYYQKKQVQKKNSKKKKSKSKKTKKSKSKKK